MKADYCAQKQAVLSEIENIYHSGEVHLKFDNLLKHDFTADRPNQKWATDFTYLYLTGGDARYNCTIIDLYDRSVIASITDRSITGELVHRIIIN